MKEVIGILSQEEIENLKKPSMKEVIGILSQEEIENLKKQYAQGVYGVEIEGHIGYFQNPTRSILNAAMSQINDSAQPLDYFENIARDTFIAGSKEVLEDAEDRFMNLVEVLKEKLTHKKAKLVNL